ncbi:MAG: hypothetical protein K2L09_02405 [Alistipes sp.]|nr:hypothetical protein [Alistipes sp.]
MLIVFAGAGWLLYNRLDFSKPIDIENYQPSAECAPAYEKLEEAIDQIAPAEDEVYDIEQTVRIMNSLEVAQSRSESFADFLEYMARQDYRGVARDVLAVKRKLFPILDEMNELRKTQKELSSVWYCLQGATRHITEQAAEEGASQYLLSLCAGGEIKALAVGVDAAFSAYQERENLKKKTEARLNRLRRQYIAYIEEYAPIYYKYMEEWDALCLEKDGAYINLYAGKTADAFNRAERVLQKHPVNREGLLLKAIALIRLGRGESGAAIQPEDAALNQQWLNDGRAKYDRKTLANPYYFTAQRILDQYMQLYPGAAAPALLLNGVLEEQLGHDQRAVAFYEQAAVEYPRQAEMLTDLLDSYVNRSYLTASVEGHYLLNYYRSTMEGAGIFSPNFRKAALFARQGKMAASQEEIYKHFFRRGNQAVQNCLLSDMQYCEEYLYGSFKPMLLEQSYVDLSYEPSSKFLGMGRKSDRLNITLSNRSDSRIENVRIFLCVHTVGMYKDDYDVVRMSQTRNIIEPYETVRFENVDIAPRNVTDITRIRAIVMTDDRVGWLDDAGVKRQTAISGIKQLFEQKADDRIRTKRAHFMRDMSTTATKLCQLLHDRTKLSCEKNGWFGGGKFYVRLPRVLALLAPCYTINPIEDTERVVMPAENRLVGDFIELEFDRIPDAGAELFVYSEIVSFRVVLDRDSDGQYVVGRVRQI